MCNTPEGSTDWAGFSVTRGAMRKFLTFNTILLGGKGKGAESCSKKLIGIS